MASEKLFQDVPPFPDDMLTADMYTISLSSLNNKDTTTSKTLFDACQELGFFLLDLKGDDLGDTVIQEIDQLWSVMQEMMNLPESVKVNFLHNAPKSFLGFKLLGEAKTEKKEPDRFEWFNLGQDGLLGNSALQPVPELVHTHKELLTSFLHHGQTIVSTICQSLARELSLPPSTFTSLQPPSKPSGTVVRFIKSYPSPNPADCRTSMIHHTDFGSVTLLANVLGGLQILSPGRSPSDPEGWLYVRPRPGCLIVNLGDAMVQWTGGLLRSNCHRITYSPGDQKLVDRYSMAILVRPEREASMKPLVEEGQRQGQYDGDQDITAWEWEVQKTMALKEGRAVMESKGGRAVAVHS